MKKFLTVAFIAMLMVCICIGGALIAQAEVAAHDHAWVVGDTEGTMKCSVQDCGAVCGTEENMHTPVWTQNAEKTQHYQICANCGMQLTEAAAHDALAWSDNGDGTHDRVCNTCTLPVIDNEPHDPDYEQNDNDEHRAFCKACQLVLGEWEACGGGVAAETSCLDLLQCSTCKKAYGDEYGTKHSADLVPASPYEVDDYNLNHGWKCADCGEVLKLEAHTAGQAATCQLGTVCTVCNQAYGPLDPSNHVWGDKYEYISATEHQAVCHCGAKAPASAHRGGTATCSIKAICSDCGEIYGDFNDVHSYDNACDADCNDCGATRLPAAHTFGEWQVTKEATETENGEQKRVCSVCGKEQTATIPALTNPNSAGEPDSNGISSKTMIIIVAAVAVVVVAGVVVAFVVINKKKKK